MGPFFGDTSYKNARFSRLLPGLVTPKNVGLQINSCQGVLMGDICVAIYVIYDIITRLDQPDG